MAVQPTAIARIIDSQWHDLTKRCNGHQLRTLDAVRRCRTASLGGHQYQCDHCGKQHIRYNSCRNRHCPQCQHTQREEWISRQLERLPGHQFYHVVFTVPDSLHELFMAYPRQLYSALMRVSWTVLQDFGWRRKYVGAQIGATMVLHTWGATMSYHPHVHCIVPAGGINLRGKWKTAKGKGKYLFPTKALSKVYRERLILALKKVMADNGRDYTQALNTQLYRRPWVVYCKPPFGGKEGVVRYLARYTHQIAITHHRIRSYDNDRVCFSYKDYRHSNVQRVMELSCKEFVRRYSMHILPKGFCRIRHYGLLSGVWTSRFTQTDRTTRTDWQQIWADKNLQLDRCKICQKGRLIMIAKIDPVRGPPRYRSFRTKT